MVRPQRLRIVGREPSGSGSFTVPERRYAGIRSSPPMTPNNADPTANRPRDSASSVAGSNASKRTPVYRSNAGVVGEVRSSEFSSTSSADFGPKPRTSQATGASELSSRRSSISDFRVSLSEANDRESRSRGPQSPPRAFVSDGGRRMSMDCMVARVVPTQLTGTEGLVFPT